jgi:hypothetical protein
MNYKVTRNGQQTEKWFNSAADAWQWIDQQLALETMMGYSRHSHYVAYYNPTGNSVDRDGCKVIIEFSS